MRKQKEYRTTTGYAISNGKIDNPSPPLRAYDDDGPEWEFLSGTVENGKLYWFWSRPVSN